MHPLRILVVEDQHDSADPLGLLLEFWGHQVAVVYEGELALELATTFRPDVVFLDIVLPGIDGCEVARQLRQLPGLENVLLAAITGYSQETDELRCQEAGIDYYFLKPVDPAELKQLLTKAKMGQLAC